MEREETSMEDDPGTTARLRRERERKALVAEQQDQREREWQDRIDYWAICTEGFRFEGDRMTGNLYWVSDWNDDGETVTLAQPLTSTAIDFIRAQDWRISGDARPLTRDEVTLMIRIHAEPLGDMTIAEGDNRAQISSERYGY